MSLQTRITALVQAIGADIKALYSGKVGTSDARLTDDREWTASTVTQAEAEAGSATTRRAWTSQRVRQAIAAWWAASAMKTKLDGIAAGATANATDAQLRDRATHTGSQAISTVTGLQAALDNKINTSERGVSGGIATLDATARIPASQLPSYVDDVLEYATTAQFPATGEGGKIYIAINQGTAANPTRQYRWTGSVYAEINPSPGTTDALAEGSTNLYFSEHRVRNTVLTGLSLAVSTAVTAADTVLSAFGKIQARLNLLGTAANANAQANAADTTVGAVLLNGAHGLGLTGGWVAGNTITGGASCNTAIRHGWWVVNSTAVDAPVAGMAGWLFVDGANASTYLTQRFIANATGVPREFRRNCFNGTWSAWVEFWHAGSFDRTALPVENQMRDSGRFGGLVDPLNLYVTTFDNVTGVLQPYQPGSAWTSAGQFFHDNSTNGGARGALTQDVSALIAAMGRTGSALRYGVEFFVGTLNTGTGTATPHVGADGTTRYLATVNNSQALSGPGNRITFVGWVRVKTGSVHLRAEGVDTWVNGTKVAANSIVLPANTWVHVRQTTTATGGYDNGFPRVYATVGANVQFACPAVFAGEVDVGIHTAPIATSPVLKDVLAKVDQEFVQTAIAPKQDKSTIITTATSRTLALTDAWNYVRPGTTSAITLTVPTNAAVAFEIGTEITIRALGNVTLAAASGVTLNAPSGGTLNMTARMTLTLKKVATNEWDVIGQTVPA